MSYPNTIDTFNDPSPTDPLNAPSHSSIETAQNDALSAIEEYLGIEGSSDSSSITYGLTSPSSLDPGHIHSVSSVQGLTQIINNLTEAIAGVGVGGGGAGNGKPKTWDQIIGGNTLSMSSDIEAYIGGDWGSGPRVTLEIPGQDPQARTLTSDWGSANRITGGFILSGFMYLLIGDNGNPEEFRVYRYDITNIAAGGSLVTFAGQSLTNSTGRIAMSTDGTYAYLTFNAGNSSNDYSISKLLISGTTFTFDSTITCGSTANLFDQLAVYSDGMIIACDITNKTFYRYSQSGTLISSFGSTTIYSGSLTFIYMFQNTLYTGHLVGSNVYNFVRIDNLQDTNPSGGLETLYPLPQYQSFSNSTVEVAAPTTGYASLFRVETSMQVNKISFSASTVTVSGSFKLGIFSEDGQSQLLDQTTGTVSSTGLFTQTLDSTLLLPQGNYYLVLVPISTTDVFLRSYDPFSSADLSVISGEPVPYGTLSVTSGTLPTTFDPTVDITSDTNAGLPIARFDN